MDKLINREYALLAEANERWQRRNLSRAIAVMVAVASLLFLAATYIRGQTASVIAVSDGDTIRVEVNGKIERVRLIGVNAPELGDSRSRVRCFARASKRFAENTLAGLPIRLEADPSQADRDRYGRLLRYVYFRDSVFNEYIIKKGYAYEYTYSRPYKNREAFRKAQKYAEESKWGVWDSRECR